MSLELITVEKLKHSNGKTFWEIREKDIIKIGDRRYLKLPCKGTHGFGRLCEEQMQTQSRCLSLTQSIGYTDLVMRRNKIQSESLVQQQAASVPSMFKSTFKPKTNRVTVCKRKDAKAHPEVMEMTIPSFGDYGELTMTVMRPISDREDLVVEFDATAIGRVIAYIQDQGLEAAKEVLPKGVWKRKHQKYPYQYSYVDEAGKRSRHYASSLEAAVTGITCGPPADDEADAAGGYDAAAVGDGDDDAADGMHAEHDVADGGEP
jgi:hypothetical protein